MTNLLQHIDRAYAGNETKTALIFGNEKLSYAELMEKVNNLSNNLYQNGIKSNSLVACILPNGIEFIVLMLAVAKLNATLVPLSFGVTNQAFVKAKKLLNFDFVMCWHALLKDKREGTSAATEIQWVSVGKKIEGLLSYEDLCTKGSTVELNSFSDDTASPYILTMTSGSTGAPKPIELSQNTKYLRAKAAIALYSIGKDDITLTSTPLYHSLAQRLIFSSLLSGGTIVVMSKFSVQSWLDTVATNNISFTIAVSSQLKQLNQYISSTGPTISSLRCIVSSSALLDFDTKIELLGNLKCEFHECYGASEIAIATSVKFNKSERGTSVGKAIPTSELVILDDQEQVLEVGKVGEIACKTPMKFSGYYQNAKLTAQSFAGDFFKTGDLGKLDSDGNLYFVGRKKEIIITGGINVYPSDIETVVKSISNVDDCVAFALNDDKLGESIGLAIQTSSSDYPVITRNIRLQCASILDHYQQPRQLFFFNQFPYNAMNKLDKLNIRKIAEQTMHEKNNKSSQTTTSLYFECRIK